MPENNSNTSQDIHNSRTIRLPENVNIIIENNSQFHSNYANGMTQDATLSEEEMRRRKRDAEEAKLDSTSLVDQVSYGFKRGGATGAKAGATFGAGAMVLAVFAAAIAFSVLFIAPALAGATVLGVTFSYTAAVVASVFVGAVAGGCAAAPSAVAGATIGGTAGAAIGSSLGAAKGTAKALYAKTEATLAKKQTFTTPAEKTGAKLEETLASPDETPAKNNVSINVSENTQETPFEEIEEDTKVPTKKFAEMDNIPAKNTRINKNEDAVALAL